MLFHYHFWTPYLEETEKFYVYHGFRISQRIGKYNGDFQTFNPPLTWDDFRSKNIIFRIIEARKGKVNITFGYGKKIMFDHIGFFVSNEEHDEVCHSAKKMKWEVNAGERRTFISTPYDFKIELQTNADVLDIFTDGEEIIKLTLTTKIDGFENDLEMLFGKSVNISSAVGDKVTIKEAAIKGFVSSNCVDPNGVNIFGVE